MSYTPRANFKKGQVINFVGKHHTIVYVDRREDLRMNTVDCRLHCIRHDDGAIVVVYPQPGDGPCQVDVLPDDTSNVTQLIQAKGGL